MKHLCIAAALLTWAATAMAQPVEVLHPFDYHTDFHDVFVAAGGRGIAAGSCGWIAFTDNGTDWAVEAGPDPEVNQLTMAACAPGTNCTEIWLGAEGQLFRSTDGGETWSSLEVEGLDTPRELHFLSPEVLLVSHSGPSFLRSADGGESWSVVPLTGSYRNEAVFVAPNLGLVLNQISFNLLRSTDLGATWDSLYHFGERPLFLDMLDAEVGYAYLQDRTVHKTTDGGQSWSVASAGTISANARRLIAFDEGHLWLSNFPNTFLFSLDGGQTWDSGSVPLEEGASGLRINGVHRSGDQVWVASNAGSIIYSSDRFETRTNVFPTDRERIRDVQFVDEALGYALCERDGLFKTTDGGATWSRILTDFATVSWDLLLRGPEDLIIPYNTSGPQRSLDGGATWSPVLPPEIADTVSLLRVEELPGGRLYFMGSAHGVYSDDNGATWTVVNHDLGSSPFGFYFYNSQLGFAGGAGGKLLRTADGGATWSVALDGELTNQPIRNIYMRDSLNGMINVTVPTYCTDDGGLTWSSNACQGYNPPNTVLPAPDGDLFSAYRSGDGAVISRSSDQGLTWEDLQPFCTRFFQLFSVSPDGRYLYGGGDGSLILRLELDAPSSVAPAGAPATALRVLPNPSPGRVQLALPAGLAEAGALALRVYNAQGQQCRALRLPVAGGICATDLSALPAGLYWLEATANGQRAFGKLLKQ